MIERINYCTVPVPKEYLSAKHKTLVKMNYVLTTFTAFSGLSDLYVLRALIVMVVWTCSYRDVWCYYHTDIVVRWFLGEPKSKSEIHRRAKRLRMEIKDVFKKYVKELETRMNMLNNYLPSSALYGRVGKLWAVDSFLIEVPFGKTNKETFKKKFELELRRRNYKQAAKLLYHYLNSKVRRRFKGEFAKKRNRSYFGFKVFTLMSPTMIVHEIQVEMANFPDNKVGFSVSGYKVVDRGFLGKSSTWLIGFPSFRRYVEFFGIFLRRYWRPYATNREMAELFVYVIALIYNAMIYTSVLSRVPES
ncbi:IS5/IS1182 family transposase [Sulfolobus sp. E5-1-F]|uniref:IS5/IS1182 family transposase n=1 Tax=Sulfolobaceae TaxID=118883 RepID=UPI0012981542|nr:MULTISPECIES: IS5/IS1182 family transposase [unclassified Sulfolobus]QGA53314.1 IS5/IS1182 family transposase [Sulfolobus sp. E5-1-F]QGA68122.1 IS5/IS1182 family transposase [Sulfolobus sp. E11-6]QGA68140.1 IS5/IS1182 family transposase [Sulfolobus sp. E11-6]QGA68283.1 IS5/IS1182 family transposase [Sulfolobus sp. E11-6]QGA68558.1 IS5/IS1182 family transposase [Sulfolobus sp. E11-6]